MSLKNKISWIGSNIGIISQIKNMDQEEFNSIVFEEYDEQYMYFFAIALVLLTIQMLVGERKVLKNLFDR